MKRDTKNMLKDIFIMIVMFGVLYGIYISPLNFMGHGRVGFIFTGLVFLSVMVISAKLMDVLRFFK